MSATTYNFTISTSFPNGIVATDRLSQEIQLSTIITALDHIDTVGDNCQVVFKDALSGGDETTLNGLVAAHDGTPLPNKAQTIQDNGAAVVAVSGLEGSETIQATHNFSDRTTWFADSARITEGLFNSGNNLTFSGSHPNWIDMVHGKVFDEDAHAAEVEHQYQVIVTVDGVTKSMIEPMMENVNGFNSGDYFVNYASGSVTFTSTTTGSVSCSYSHESGSTWYLRPSADRALDIIQAEMQFSSNVEFNDSIHFEVYALVDAVAPQYLQSNGGPFPSGYMLRVELTKYKSMYQMVDEALGSYPVIPSIGGASSRGMTSAVYGFPFAYEAVRTLDSRIGAEVRVKLAHNIAFGGDRSTGTFYCVSRKV